MMDFIKRHPLNFSAISIALIFIVVLFFASFYNHYYVNISSQKSIENLSMNFEKVKENIEMLVNVKKGKIENVSKELNSQFLNIEGATHELLNQYQKIFDANTVTFLITFLSALLFTVFITLFIKNIEQFNKMCELKDKMSNADLKISEADKKIKIADNRIVEIDSKISEANEDWNSKLQFQRYLLKLSILRNSLTQILNLVSVLGSLLASSKYDIKDGYNTLVYMIQRKTHSLIEEGFNDIDSIRNEDKSEFLRIISDCITYLNIDELEHNKFGFYIFQQLYGDLIEIQNRIKNIPLSE